MRCNCCRAEVTQFNGQCPVCGFPMLTGGDIEIESFVRSYRENKLRGVTVYLKTYEYEPEGRSLRLVNTRYVEVAEPLSLGDGEIRWLDLPFMAIESSRPVSLDVCVRRGNDEREYTVAAVPSGTISHQAIGVTPGEGFSIQFAVGSAETYALSERVPLL
ncbi:MAG: hypothetical protein IK104_04100 [Clostridia bacterium]|nr:hypothetical protein [Clostridia bacterium]